MAQNIMNVITNMVITMATGIFLVLCAAVESFFRISSTIWASRQMFRVVPSMEAAGTSRRDECDIFLDYPMGV